MNDQGKTEQCCCPKFDPSPWDGQEFVWGNRRFIKDKVFTLFFMPINFGGVIGGMMKKIEASGAKCQDGMWLSDHTSKWNMDLYVAVDKEVANAENAILGGKFFSKVYEGSFRDTGKWCKDFEALAKGRGLKIKKTYLWYTTCPKCAKKYGKNYVVVVGQVG